MSPDAELTVQTTPIIVIRLDARTIAGAWSSEAEPRVRFETPHAQENKPRGLFQVADC
jgi:hypothetical protein